jgi:CRISPR-associated protein Csm2
MEEQKNESNILRKIIVDGNADEHVKRAKELGIMLAEAKVSPTSIRNIFESVKKVQMYAELKGIEAASSKLILLKPKMEYAAVRAEKDEQKAIRDLVKELSTAIDLIGSDSNCFERFVEYFEAILAYHTVHRKREGD